MRREHDIAENRETTTTKDAVYCVLCGGDAHFCKCPRVPSFKFPDIYLKFTSEMFQLLVAGKEVVVLQSDGSKWHILLEEMGWNEMAKAIRVAKLEATSHR